MITGTQAYAQKSRFPEFSLSDKIEENIIKNQSDDVVTIKLKRPLTRDILLLQEQINILEALIKRQSEISKIADNYEKIGIPFSQPTPKLNVCEKLPKNILCLYSYPDLKSYENLFEDAGIRFQQKQDEAMQIALAEITAQMQEDANNSVIDDVDFENIPDNLNELVESITPVERDEYTWSDIQCLASKCSALLVSTTDPDDSFRVFNGQHVNEHIKITSITPMGVKAQIHNQIKNIKPLALDGQTQVVNRQTQIQPSNQLANIAVNDVLEDNNIAPSNIIDPPVQGATPSSNDAPAPLLGPTGLF